MRNFRKCSERSNYVLFTLTLCHWFSPQYYSFKVRGLSQTESKTMKNTQLLKNKIMCTITLCTLCAQPWKNEQLLYFHQTQSPQYKLETVSSMTSGHCKHLIMLYCLRKVFMSKCFPSQSAATIHLLSQLPGLLPVYGCWLLPASLGSLHSRPFKGRGYRAWIS